MYRTGLIDDSTFEEVIFTGVAWDIGVGSDGAVAIVDSNGDVYRLNDDDSWTEIPSNENMVVVAVGNTDNIFGLDNSDYVYKLNYEFNPSVPGCSWIG